MACIKEKKLTQGVVKEDLRVVLDQQSDDAPPVCGFDKQKKSKAGTSAEKVPVTLEFPQAAVSRA
jgi:hypothetical protein